MKKQDGPAFATKIDIKLAILDLEEKLEKKFAELDDKFAEKFDQIFNKLDPVIAEIENSRLDRELGAGQTSAIREQVEDHEKRIAKLESPQTS